jgi:hypothetical protein
MATKLHLCADLPLASDEKHKDVDRERSIVLQGEIDLAHDFRVMKCLARRSPSWINWLEAAACLVVSGLCLYRCASTGDLIALFGSALCVLIALCALIGKWVLVGSFLGLLWLVRLSYRWPVAYTVNGDGVKKSGSLGESFHHWSEFSRALVDGGLVFLLGAGRQMNSVLVTLPLDWCADADARDALISLLHARLPCSH